MHIHLKEFSGTEPLISQTLELFRSLFPIPGKTQQAPAQPVPMPGKTQQAPAQPVPRLGKNDGVMLAGGRTPLEIYRRAAAEGLSTDATLFLSDERYVPASDPQSNYGTISPFFNVGQASCLSAHALLQTTADRREALSHFIKIKTELPLEEAAQAFHNDLSQLERIPLGLLGLGTDGHTASLFNLKDAALRDERLAIPVRQCKASIPLAQNERDAHSTFINQRISVTPTLLNRIERIIILATGAEKKEMIQTLLNHPESIPAGVALADHPRVEVWTDQNI